MLLCLFELYSYTVPQAYNWQRRVEIKGLLLLQIQVTEYMF